MFHACLMEKSGSLAPQSLELVQQLSEYILNLRAAVAKMLSVTSSLHAYRERVGGVRDRQRAGIRGGDQGVRGGGPYIGGSPTATDD